MTRKQAEDLTQTLTEVLCTNREKLAECYVPKSALEKARTPASGAGSSLEEEHQEGGPPDKEPARRAGSQPSGWGAGQLSGRPAEHPT